MIELIAGPQTGGGADRSAGGAAPLDLGVQPAEAIQAIPWARRRLVVGIGVDGALPIDEAVVAEAALRGVELVALPTDEACAILSEVDLHDTAAILHVTC